MIGSSLVSLFNFPDTYNISNAEGVVARFCLFKPAFKLGEDIIGTIDFSQSTVPCLQVISYHKRSVIMSQIAPVSFHAMYVQEMPHGNVEMSLLLKRF